MGPLPTYVEIATFASQILEGGGEKNFDPQNLRPLRQGPQLSRSLGALAAPIGQPNFTPLRLYMGDPKISQWSL